MDAESDRSRSRRPGRLAVRRTVAATVTTLGLLVGIVALTPSPAAAAPPTHISDCTGSASEVRRWVTLLYVRGLFRCDSAADSEFGVIHFEPASVRGGFSRAVFRSSEGSRKWAGQAYLLFLQRSADAAGSAYWTNLLHTGTRYDAFESNLIGSSEYFNHAGATNPAFVDAVYNDLLDRAPSGAEAAFWVGQINAGSTRAGVALSIDRSSERRRHIADIFGYTYILHRAAAVSDLTYWAGQQASGIDQLDLMAAFTASQEAVNKANTVIDF